MSGESKGSERAKKKKKNSLSLALALTFSFFKYSLPPRASTLVMSHRKFERTYRLESST